MNICLGPVVVVTVEVRVIQKKIKVSALCSVRAGEKSLSTLSCVEKVYGDVVLKGERLEGQQESYMSPLCISFHLSKVV